MQVRVTHSAAHLSGCHIRRVDVYQDLLPLHCAHPGRYPHLLESVLHGTDAACFDVLFAFPGASMTLDDRGVLLDERHMDGDFLACMDAWWSEQRIEGPADTESPFRGGWFVYLGYELAARIEPTLRLPATPPELPSAFVTRFPAAIVRDHRRRCTLLVAEAGHEPLIEVMARDLKRGAATPAQDGAPALEGGLNEDDPALYLEAVARVKRYIVDGDVFQVNLSRAWHGRLAPGMRACELYRRLRRHNPAPFAGLATWGETAVISSSPERLICLRDGTLETRPIAGTRPRAAIESADADFARELLAHPKERAEHIMLVDLERNDLGRVCVPGSVRVSELMALESYAHVHHIVSTVRGRPREGTTPARIIRAVFPGGTITGCPKVRCMEIIAELEQVGRGAYTGSMGYLNRDGSLDLNILIRTMVTQDRGIRLRTGGGIVADSIPERELEETRAKARGLVLALAPTNP
ncbi:MAG: aminodeoxychorismate synthase component I [Gammaproteobacteria bacterium]|nr:aminodeoxychorismate synthase component I [Gammaproteobacteria bacterium]